MIIWKEASLATKAWYISEILGLTGSEADDKLNELDNIARNMSVTVLLNEDLTPKEILDWEDDALAQEAGLIY